MSISEMCRDVFGIWDAHLHLDAEAFDVDRADVVARARRAGVVGFVLAGTDPGTWDRTQAVADAYGGVAVLGVHPWWGASVVLDDALSQLQARRPQGIGEIGLDGIRARTDEARARQRVVFRRQLALARDLDVPVVMHCVRAAPELLTVLERDGLPRAGGIVHGWMGPADLVARAVGLGLCLSFGPGITRARAVRGRAAAIEVPSRHLLVETDSPDQAVGGRGRGEPAQLVEVLAEVARLRDTDPGALGAQITENLARFGWIPSRRADP